jgi:hypothetical protein
VAQALEVAGQLAGEGRLTRPCRPASMITVGGCLANDSRRPHHRVRDSSSWHDLDDLLGRVERLGTSAAPRRVLEPGDEAP